jgi:SpoIIAA-like
VSGKELRHFKPVMEQLSDSGDIRIVEVIASDYEGFGPGGFVEDLKLGFGTLFQHYSDFNRIAVVSDKAWVAHTLHALAWMIPGELALFGLDELEQAKKWAAG